MVEPKDSADSNKRRTLRRKAALRISLNVDPSVLDNKAAYDGPGESLTLLGYTLDMNETGLSLILPSFRIDEEFCADQSRTLQVEIALPKAPVVMEAAPVHCKPVDAREPHSGYLLGLRVISMNEGDQQRFLRFLREAS
jgi:hypothetical protein